MQVVLHPRVCADFCRHRGIFCWASGVPAGIFPLGQPDRQLMALSIDATMFILLRRTLEARALRLVEAERDAAPISAGFSQQERLEALASLAAGMAHDFNNLLGIILNSPRSIADR